MKAWKAAEYRAAETIGGKRIALSGGPGSSHPGDVEIPGWLVEVKYRKILAVMSWFLPLEKQAKKQRKNPLLILTERNTPGQLAVMRLEYFKELTDERQNQPTT